MTGKPSARAWWLGVLVGGLVVTQAWAGPEVAAVFSGRALTGLTPTITEPTLTVDGGWEATFDDFGVKVLGGLETKAGTTSWDLTDGWLTWTAGPVQTKVGWWPEPTGPAVFHSLVPVFLAPPATDFLATAGTNRPQSPAKGALRLVLDEWTLTAEAAPWLPSPKLPDANSIWFPKKDIPPQFEVYPGRSLGLSSIQVEAGPSETSDPSTVRLTLTWAAVGGDFSVGYFQGLDSQLLFPARFLPFSPGSDEYTVVLQPKRARVQTGWVTAEIPAGWLRVWGESSFTSGRLRNGSEPIQDPQNPNFFSSIPVATSVWESVAGASVSWGLGSWGTLRGWVEGSLYRNSDGTPPPDFAEGAEVGLHWDFARDMGSWDFMTGTPWDPHQGWLWTRLTWAWAEGRTLWVGVPLLWGPSDSEWGQFSNRRLVAVGTNWEQ